MLRAAGKKAVLKIKITKKKLDNKMGYTFPEFPECKDCFFPFLPFLLLPIPGWMNLHNKKNLYER